VIAMAVKCDTMASPRIGRRHESPPREQQPMTSHFRADEDPCIAE
jgi:hypothetical protein